MALKSRISEISCSVIYLANYKSVEISASVGYESFFYEYAQIRKILLISSKMVLSIASSDVLFNNFGSWLIFWLRSNASIKNKLASISIISIAAIWS